MPQQIIVVQKSATIPEIVNSKNRTSRNQSIAILSIKEKMPKVKSFNGQVILSRIGLIKKLIKPSTVPTKTKICQFCKSFIPKKVLPLGSIITPGLITFQAMKIPKILVIILQIKFSIIFTKDIKNSFRKQVPNSQFLVIGDGETMRLVS